MSRFLSALRSAGRGCRLALAFASSGGLIAAAEVIAGGSAETTLVVVNAASPLSQRIGNEYLQLRHIPETHLLRLSDVPSFGALPIADFRTKVWAPIRDYIRGHGLEEEIDLIAYSGDFPYAVDFRSDIKDKQLPENRQRGNAASLTGLTYFARRVEASNTGYLGGNHYFREFAGLWSLDGNSGSGPFEASHGFRNRYVWANSDLAYWEPGDGLDQYYLSAMLAYTGARGNSFPEIARYLTDAAAGDGASPDGTVYLMENANVRSKTRQPLFAATVAELARRGRKAEILVSGRDGQDGIVPRRRPDVIGAVIGASRFDWEKSGSRLLPGSIAESLTSFGGDFDTPIQTKLSASLRYGAAGSSGTVAEPFALQQKFPVPFLHAYYADGCSLAEAYYQSVFTPYQLIVVGDPLARPFASFADVRLDAPDLAAPWSGTVAIRPVVRPAAGRPVRAVELWVDGQHVASGRADSLISWDTRSVEDGSHDIRLVAVEDSLIETRSVFQSSVSVFNHERRVDVETFTTDVRYGEPVAIAGRAEGARRVELRRGHEVIKSIDIEQARWSMTVPSAELGMGTASLVVRADYREGRAVRSAPLSITVREPPLWPAASVERPSRAGLRAIVEEGAGENQHVVVDQLNGVIKELGKGRTEYRKVKLAGLLGIERPGTYQVAVGSTGRVRLRLHGRLLVDETLSAGGAERFVAVGLEAGWHPLEIELAPAGKRTFLKVVLGGEQAPVVLSKENLAHH